MINKPAFSKIPSMDLRIASIALSRGLFGVADSQLGGFRQGSRPGDGRLDTVRPWTDRLASPAGDFEVALRVFAPKIQTNVVLLDNIWSGSAFRNRCPDPRGEISERIVTD